MNTTSTSTTIGERIRSARKQAGLTRAELASAVGASVQAVGFWETGVNEPRNRHLQALCKALGIALIDRISIAAASAPISDQIRVARNLCGLTLATVGERLGVSAQAVHAWETGSAYPTHQNLVALSALLGVQSHTTTDQPDEIRTAAAPARPTSPVLHELLAAEVIICTMLGVMTTDQKLAIATKLEELGVAGEGATRFHERRAALVAAGAA